MLDRCQGAVWCRAWMFTSPNKEGHQTAPAEAAKSRVVCPTYNDMLECVCTISWIIKSKATRVCENDRLSPFDAIVDSIASTLELHATSTAKFAIQLCVPLSRNCRIVAKNSHTNKNAHCCVLALAAFHFRWLSVWRTRQWLGLCYVYCTVFCIVLFNTHQTPRSRSQNRRVRVCVSVYAGHTCNRCTLSLVEIIMLAILYVSAFE